MDSQNRRKRRRTRLSCMECHRRKVRCDRNDPCGRCMGAEIRCVYKADGDECSTRGNSTESPSSRIAQLSAASVRLPRHAEQDTPPPSAPKQHDGSQREDQITEPHRDDLVDQENVRGILSKARLLGNTHPITTYRQVRFSCPVSSV